MDTVHQSWAVDGPGEEPDAEDPYYNLCVWRAARVEEAG